jgi:hypothetical protein
MSRLPDPINLSGQSTDLVPDAIYGIRTWRAATYGSSDIVVLHGAYVHNWKNGVNVAKCTQANAITIYIEPSREHVEHIVDAHKREQFFWGGSARDILREHGLSPILSSPSKIVDAIERATIEGFNAGRLLVVRESLRALMLDVASTRVTVTARNQTATHKHHGEAVGEVLKQYGIDTSLATTSDIYLNAIRRVRPLISVDDNLVSVGELLDSAQYEASWQVRISFYYPNTSCSGVAPDCTCGFYAYTGSQAMVQANNYMLGTTSAFVGVIRGTGLTTVGTKGFRTQNAEILAVAPKVNVARGGIRPDLIERVRSEFSFPVFDDVAALAGFARKALPGRDELESLYGVYPHNIRITAPWALGQ